MSDDTNQPRRPEVEPEILPPERPHSFGWPNVSPGTRQRIYIRPLGPIGVAFLLLVLGLIAAAFLLVLLGAVLIWIPLLAGLVVAGAVARRLLRR